MASSLFEMLVDQQKAALDETQKMWQRFFSLPRVVEQARETKVGSTPHDVVYEEDSLKLLHYRRETPALYAEPVLVCYALVNRAVHPRPPGRQERDPPASGPRLRRLHDRLGHAVRGRPQPEAHDYVCGFLKNVVDFVLAAEHVAQLNLLGYCMGGAMSTMFTALYPGARQEPDPAGRADRLQQPSVAAPPLDRREELRHRCPDRHLRQLPCTVPPGRFRDDEAGPEPLREILHVL